MLRTARIIILTGLICLTAAIASAQSTASVISTRPLLSVDKVKQGSRFQAAVIVDITSGYHINSNRPSETYLIATSLKFGKLAGLTPGLVAYPKGELKKFAFSDKPLSVYQGRVILKFSGTAGPSLATGNHSIHAKLTAQACNDEACLQPKTIDVEIPFEVVERGAQVNPANGDIFGTTGSKRH